MTLEVAAVAGVVFVTSFIGGLGTAWVERVPLRLGMWAALLTATAIAVTVSVGCAIGRLIFGGAP